MLSDTGRPGFSYFLNTPCEDWDVLQYHKAWKAAKLTMDKASVTRAIEKQIHYITIHGSGKEKQNAIRFQKQFELPMGLRLRMVMDHASAAGCNTLVRNLNVLYHFAILLKDGQNHASIKIELKHDGDNNLFDHKS
nr:5220_t:CDS:2 [Entrophospora candida]